MKTPIASFLEKYAGEDCVRLHMPGHKGVGDIAEKYDITEIVGADSLFEANGIICESEGYAGELFGADTFYSTEGSSLSIRAMTYLVSLYAKSKGDEPLIAAARNVHKSFVSAAALIGFEVDWLTADGISYLSCRLSADDVRRYLKEARKKPTAIYITSPDYLGYTADTREIARVCHEAGVLLMVDNAHGAYLKFLPNSEHPIDLGADMCCDSAHKTLGALTGAAYLHISKNAPAFFKENAKSAMMLFASTSPSYLILRSLDMQNAYLKSYPKKLCSFISRLDGLKAELAEYGYTVIKTEPMKLTIAAKEFGYTGYELADKLAEAGIYSEFSDPDFLVLMPTPENSEGDLLRLSATLLSIKKKDRIAESAPRLSLPKRAISIRDAILSSQETVPVDSSLGRVLAQVSVGCPPAVPIIVSGEIIDENAIDAFKYYNIKFCSVVK